MTENKRFSYEIEMFKEELGQYNRSGLVKLLLAMKEENEQLKNRIEDYNTALKRLQELSDKKIKENEQLKAQLYCDSDEGVCSICDNHYLVQGKTYDKYYISKCKKGHNECSKESLKYCEDFELKNNGDVE